MQTFDVYLKKRLTEIDVIISQLVQRDAFSMYDWLYLDCSMSDIQILKNLTPEATMFLDAQLDNFLELVHEKAENELNIDVDISLLNQILASGETEMILSAEEMNLLEKSFFGGESVLEISVDPLDFSIAHSFGKVSFDMEMFVEKINTLKFSLEKFDGVLNIAADIDFSSLKSVELSEIGLELDVSPMDIFYLLTIGGIATTYINALPLDDYILKKVLYDVDAEMTLNVDAIEDFGLTKFLDIDNSFTLFADITDILIQLISPETEIVLDCEASAGLKRYRLLAEMDDHSLSDFDDMTLEELDYVIIAE